MANIETLNTVIYKAKLGIPDLAVNRRVVILKKRAALRVAGKHVLAAHGLDHARRD